jgi:folate-binding protein YgfZ
MAEEGKTLRLLRSEFENLKGGAAVAILGDWVVYRLKGEDALDWLQGQATNDLRPLGSENQLIESCLCSATGQLTALFLVGRFDDRLYLVTPATCESEIVQRVERMVILEDVELEKMPLLIQIQAHEVKDKSTPSWFTKLLLPEGLMLSLVPPEEAAQKTSLSEEAIEGLMVASGTPRFGKDTHAKSLPPELGADFDSRYVHYAKGCYMGQEVLQRIHSRGHTNKTWVQIEIRDAQNLTGPFGLPDFPRSVITSELWLDSGVVYLGTVLRNDSFEYGDTVNACDSAGHKSAGTVLRMPIYPFA